MFIEVFRGLFAGYCVAIVVSHRFDRHDLIHCTLKVNLQNQMLYLNVSFLFVYDKILLFQEKYDQYVQWKHCRRISIYHHVVTLSTLFRVLFLHSVVRWRYSPVSWIHSIKYYAKIRVFIRILLYFVNLHMYKFISKYNFEFVRISDGLVEKITGFPLPCTCCNPSLVG